MRFTKAQYDAAIESLREASSQLEPNGDCCHCCGDSGHQAFECGFNPLVAMAVCKAIAEGAAKLHEEIHGGLAIAAGEKLHEILHWEAGYDTYMGMTLGPAKVRMPGPNGWPKLSDYRTDGEAATKCPTHGTARNAAGKCFWCERVAERDRLAASLARMDEAPDDEVSSSLYQEVLDRSVAVDRELEKMPKATDGDAKGGAA